MEDGESESRAPNLTLITRRNFIKAFAAAAGIASGFGEPNGQEALRQPGDSILIVDIPQGK